MRDSAGGGQAGDGTAEQGLPVLPPEVAAGIDRLAGESAVDSRSVWLAAQAKVAAAVTGFQEWRVGGGTWRDLIAWAATEQGREQARAAWRAAQAQEYVGADRVAAYLERALHRMTTAPNAPHHLDSLLSAAELDQLLLGFAGPVRELPDRRCHELFEERVRRHPDAVAAVQGDRSWTYAELNRRANILARSLHEQGLRPEDIVAVVCERTLEWLAAVLAVFKAGGCYLPLEPRFPAERIATVLARSEARWVLAERGVPHLEEALTGREGIRTAVIDEVLARGGPDDDLGLPVAADQLAYIYFTSGSTGEPKGAMCEHNGFLNHVLAKIEDLGIEEGYVVAQTAPQCFDISLWQLVSALLVGGRTHIVEQEAVLDVRRFIDTLADGGVQVAQLVPSYLEVVLSALEEEPRALPRLRCVSVTGEALKKELAERWFAAFPEVLLANAYGLTETSDDTNHEVMDRVPDTRSVPLGKAVRNVRVYVVDEWLSPVPLGVPGEIVFSGVCVGRGYVNDEARTKAAFGQDPYRPGERLYRSGDFGRWLPGGTLEFLGRRDSQVKINGFRIEIGEIENRLLQVPGVRDGAVVVTGSPERRALVGYYTTTGPLATEDVRRALAAALPAYMVPRHLHHRAELPLTDNGKTDRKALARMAEEAVRQAGGDASGPPATATERRVAAIWAELLDIPSERIGRDTHFTELGGTSLTAIRLAVALDRVVTVEDLADTPTVAEVAALVDRKAGENGEAGERGETGEVPGTEQAVQQASQEAAPVPVTGPAADGPRPVRSDSGLAVLTAASGEGAAAGAVWAERHRTAVHAAVAEHGAVLLRGLGVATPADVAAVAAALGIEAMTERERFAPRADHGDGVYGSSEWPAAEPMCMHHELSYATEVPGLLLFGCLTAPASGGRTGVADSQAVMRALPAGLVDRFTRDGWLLTRMYHDIGVSWTEAFGTGDRAEVDAYCAAAALEHTWLPGDRLRTRQRRAAVVHHPRTGAPVWFNQAAFLNERTLDPVVRDYLVDVYGPEGLPFNTAYGDGTPIDTETVETLNAAYRDATVSEPWQDGDVLLVDNLRMAHSRDPYQGARDVVVVLGDPVRLPGHVLS
ncbi:non-ribosomal peptide synthetase [Streptomyces albofaciens]|uniref:non-ribosomal peptide synthetase n=1 Tax=Streptomyces albofaciens TaxID=66866 RepID=UPI003CC70D68